MNIEIVGHVCKDRNTSENITYEAAGSPAMFMNRIYRQFPNTHIGIIASSGPDFEEYRRGVDVYPLNPNASSTLVYENVSKGGTRTQKAFNRDQAVPVQVDAEVERRIKNADIVFYAPILPNYPGEYYAQINSHRKEGSLAVLLPQGYYRSFDSEDNVIAREFDEATKILPFVDLVIVSEQDHEDMFNICKQWVAANPNLTAVVTLGEKGAVAITSAGEIEVPTRPVPEKEIVDTVGSGDIFSAALAYRFRETGDIKEAVRFANEIARQTLFYAADDIKIDFEAALKG